MRGRDDELVIQFWKIIRRAVTPFADVFRDEDPESLTSIVFVKLWPQRRQWRAGRGMASTWISMRALRIMHDMGRKRGIEHRALRHLARIMAAQDRLGVIDNEKSDREP